MLSYITHTSMELKLKMGIQIVEITCMFSNQQVGHVDVGIGGRKFVYSPVESNVIQESVDSWFYYATGHFPNDTDNYHIV